MNTIDRIFNRACDLCGLTDTELKTALITEFPDQRRGILAVLDPTSNYYKIEGSNSINWAAWNLRKGIPGSGPPRNTGPQPTLPEVPLGFRITTPPPTGPLFGIHMIQCTTCFKHMRSTDMARHKRGCKGLTYDLIPGKYICPYCIELQSTTNRSRHHQRHTTESTPLLHGSCPYCHQDI